MTRPLVILGILLFLVSPAHATLPPGTERGVTLPIVDTAAFSQTQARVATDGSSFYAVWLNLSTDQARRPTQIFGVRLSESGARSGEPVLLGTTSWAYAPPFVTWTGFEYVVMWETGSGLNGRLVDRDGVPAPSERVFARFARPPIRPIHIAFNGKLFLVIVSDVPDQYHGMVLDRIGRGDDQRFHVSPADLRTISDLTAIGETFYAITSYVDMAGTPNGNGFPSSVKAIPITVFTPPSTPGLAGMPIEIAPATTPVFDLQASQSDGGFTVAWTTAAGIAGGEIRSAHVSRSGVSAVELFPAEGLRLHKIAGDVLLYGASDQTHFFRRGTSAGDVAAPDSRAVVADAATNGSATLLLFEALGRIGFDYGPAGGDLYSGTLEEQRFEPVVLAPRHQTSPDIAASNDLRLAAWSEYIGRDRRLGVVATRIGALGHPLDGIGIDLGVSTYYPTLPRVASNGNDWLVTWADGSNVFATRVSQSGVVLDSTPLLVGEGIYGPATLAVAWDGRSYVVVYLQGGFFKGAKVRVKAARVSPAGQKIGEMTLTDIGPMQSIAIAGSGDGTLIAWDSYPTFNGALLSRTDTITPVALASHRRPSVAWNGTEFLVAGVVGGGLLQWQMVNASGVIRTPSAQQFPAITALYPAIDVEPWNGGFLATWSEGTELLTAFISADGTLEDGPVLVATIPADYSRNFGAAGNAIVYPRTIEDPVRDITRVFLRTIEREAAKPRRRATR